ncbi:hypothetical protein BHM03_00000168 [Ensete ventricosum]|nr:hypothetical protein BHM03_00000168 [Ensete ventricosum]
MAEERWRTRRQGRGYRKRYSREKDGEPGVGEVAAGSRGKAEERQREGTGKGKERRKGAGAHREKRQKERERERGERKSYECEEGERGRYHRPREEKYRRRGAPPVARGLQGGGEPVAGPARRPTRFAWVIFLCERRQEAVRGGKKMAASTYKPGRGLWSWGNSHADSAYIVNGLDCPDIRADKLSAANANKAMLIAATDASVKVFTTSCRMRSVIGIAADDAEISRKVLDI